MNSATRRKNISNPVTKEKDSTVSEQWVLTNLNGTFVRTFVLFYWSTTVIYKHMNEKRLEYNSTWLVRKKRFENNEIENMK